MVESFKSNFEQSRKRFEQKISKILEQTSLSSAPASYRKTITYSINAGGKRLRPILCLESAKLNGISNSRADKIAVALELIHTYSLVHDDLPALDNDSLRRGKPANHVRFGEAFAILAGDGLQSLAFELLAAARVSSQGLSLFSKSIGSAGMVLGQFLDINGSRNKSIAYLNKMHSLKTGKLISLSFVLPFIESNQSRSEIRVAKKFSERIGLLFQIIDDILDATQSSKKLGKSANKDENTNKLTYVAKWGINKAKALARREADALSKIANQHYTKSFLIKEMPMYILNRDK